jgi:hypothetical protein
MIGTKNTKTLKRKIKITLRKTDYERCHWEGKTQEESEEEKPWEDETDGEA